MQVWVLVLQPDHGTQESCICSWLYSFFSVTAVQWSTYTEQNVKTGTQIYAPSALDHACQLLYKSITLSLWRVPTWKMPPCKFGTYNATFFFLNGLVLLGFFFFFVQKKVQYDIILGGRWQLSLRDDKIARNTPPAVLHCFNIVLFNKKMTPSAWMTTPKWTINIPYIRKSWKLKYTA